MKRAPVVLSSARTLLTASIATLLAASGCVGAPRAGSVVPERETADWLPLKGRVRIGRTWGHPGGHAFPAVDFEVPAGESIRVYAAGPGTVFARSGDCPDTSPSGKEAGCNGGNGNFVDIIHPDGRRSRYLHLREGSVVVALGQHVCRGCLVGRSGWSGNVTPLGPEGAHLHYEELIGYTLVPPGPMFAQGRVGDVSYPGPGRTWSDIGVRHPMVLNRGFPPSSPPPRGTCFGWAPTLVGSAGREAIRGTAGHDVILAGHGNDIIDARGGEDRICGGDGDDILIGGLHPDQLEGGGGDDTCFQGDAGGIENAAPGRILSCESPSYVLTVTSAGRVVTSEPPGISCPADCTARYVTHTKVVLTASPVSRLWAGCDTTPTHPTCRVTMSRDRTVRV